MSFETLLESFTENFNQPQAFVRNNQLNALEAAVLEVPQETAPTFLMGGDVPFFSALAENFEAGHYRHDNEPGHHYIYLFDYCGQPWKTQELVRKHTSKENYRNEPLGINGNDDCGQMSAWYIFSVMGFYPVTPGSDIFAIGAPQFPKITLHLTHNGNLKTVEIIADNLSEENKYVHSITLDGKQLKKPFIKYAQIMNAQKLIFEMTDLPQGSSSGSKNDLSKSVSEATK